MGSIKKSFKDSISPEVRRARDAAESFVLAFDSYEDTGPVYEDDLVVIIDWHDVMEELNDLKKLLRNRESL